MDFEEIYSRRKKEEDERDGVEIKNFRLVLMTNFIIEKAESH